MSGRAAGCVGWRVMVSMRRWIPVGTGVAVVAGLFAGGPAVADTGRPAHSAEQAAHLADAPDSAGQSASDSADSGPSVRASSRTAASKSSRTAASKKGALITARATWSGCTVSVRVNWNNKLDTRRGRDAFHVRAVAQRGTRSTVFDTENRTGTQPGWHSYQLRASKQKTCAIVKHATSIVVAISQQHSRKTPRRQQIQHDGNAPRHRQIIISGDVYEANAATILTLGRAPQRTADRSLTPRAARDCSRIEIKPGADLRYCNLSRAYLSGSDLSGVNLHGATLTGAVLTACNFNSAKLAGANLAGAVFGGISGTPLSLPEGWTLIDSDIVYMEPISL